MNNGLLDTLQAYLKPTPAPKDLMPDLIQVKQGSNTTEGEVDPIFEKIFIDPGGGENVLFEEAKKERKNFQSAYIVAANCQRYTRVRNFG